MQVKPKGESQWETTQVKVYANTEKSYLISDEIEVYQDNITTVSITPSNHSVFVGDSSPRLVKQARLQAMQPYQDTLLAYAEIKACTALENGAEKVELVLKERGQRLFQLKGLTVIHQPA
ncbi:MAG: hypothetical protein AAFU67_15410, partial [Bacteroidota bacterium]